MTAILVTGGSGFIGRALVRRLVDTDVEVRIPSRSPDRFPELSAAGATLVEADLGDRSACVEVMAGVDEVYHLAGWISTRRADSAQVFESNKSTTANLLHAIELAKPRKVVYLASIFALAGASRDPVTEASPYNLGAWQISYFRAKREAELLVAAAVAKGAPIVSVYPTFCLGPGDDGESSAGVLLEYLRAPAGVYVSGGINVLHVDDAASGLWLGMKKGAVGRQYLVGGDNVSWHQLHGMAAALAGVRKPRFRMPGGIIRGFGAAAERLAPKLGLDRGGTQILSNYWYYDDSRARDELGYSSRPLEETVVESIEWYRQSGKLRGQ